MDAVAFDPLLQSQLYIICLADFPATCVLSSEQQPFWLTGGSIALSNLSITPPPQARWWWKEKISFVFVQHLAVRFSIDACTRQLIWEDNLLCIGDRVLNGKMAAVILQNLLSTGPRYSRLVESFGSLAALDEECRFLESLKSEATAQLTAEKRTAQEKAAKQAAEASQRRFVDQQGERQRPKP